MSFVHLHTHSEYSLLDGANRIPDLVAHVKKLGMDSLAVTDHGNMHAAWTFYEHAKAQKIRPILGFEAYLAFGPRTAREKPPGPPRRTATSSCWPRIAPAIETWSGSPRSASSRVSIAGPGSTGRCWRPTPRASCVWLPASRERSRSISAREDTRRPRRSAEWFSQTFGPGGFWLEIQQHGIPDERPGHRGNAAPGPGAWASAWLPPTTRTT